jgi:hypothetical protein
LEAQAQSMRSRTVLNLGDSPTRIVDLRAIIRLGETAARGDGTVKLLLVITVSSVGRARPKLARRLLKDYLSGKGIVPP